MSLRKNNSGFTRTPSLASLRIRNKDSKMPNLVSGFTLLETMITIGIVFLIMSFGILVTTDSYKRTIFRSERSILVSALSRARERSMNNYFQSPSGLCYDNSNPKSPTYVLFRGLTYSPSPNNEQIAGNAGVTVSSTPNIFPCSLGGVVFLQLSGDTQTVQIAITKDGRTSLISLNHAGQIDW